MIATVVLVAIAARAFGAVGSAQSWSVPSLVDRGRSPGSVVGVNGISCPSSSLCIAVDQIGQVLVSRSPLRSTGPWRVFRPISGETPALFGVSCASVSLCVAVGEGGAILTSTSPTTGARGWRVSRLGGAESHEALVGVSCPSAALCVAVGPGVVVVSTDPGAMQPAWRVDRVDVEHGFASPLEGVSCPSVSLCVAVDFFRNVVTSDNPTAGAGAWSVAPVPGGDGLPLNAVSCGSPSFCVIVDQAGDAVTSTNPTAGSGAWTVKRLGASPLSGVSCVLPGACVAVDTAGRALATGDAGSDAARWSVAQIDPTNSLTAVSCPSRLECAATDAAGNLVVTPPATRTADRPTLFATRRPSLRRHAAAWFVDAGTAIQCPRGRRSCNVAGRWSEQIGPVATIALRVPPGARREVTFQLTPGAVRLLYRNGVLNLTTSYVAQLDTRNAVAEERVFRVVR